MLPFTDPVPQKEAIEKISFSILGRKFRHIVKLDKYGNNKTSSVKHHILKQFWNRINIPGTMI